MDILQKAAEILVQYRYAEALRTHNNKFKLSVPQLMWYVSETDNMYEIVNLFIDTLESRKQADAIEDYLWDKETILWRISMDMVDLRSNNNQWRLDRIEWCLEELIK